MKKRGYSSLVLIFCLLLLFAWIISLSFGGWGYPGYYGYHRGPSFWYWGGGDFYMAKNIRSQSVSGPRHVGGGPQSGK